MKTSICFILGLLLALGAVYGATYNYRGGTYTGVMPNCTAAYLNVNSNTVWNNMEINLSCGVVFSRILALNNVTLRFNQANTSEKTIYGINGTAQARRLIIDNNSVYTSKGNNTYIYIPFTGYLHNNTNITIRNSRLYNLGQPAGYSDTNRKEGLYIKNCGNGSIIQGTRFINGIQGLYVSIGSSGSLACKINVTNSSFTDIRYTSVEFIGSGGVIRQNASYFGYNYLNGPGNGTGITGYGIFTSNTKGLQIVHNYFTDFNYYALDITQGDQNMTVAYNTFYNNKNPIVLNTQIYNTSIKYNTIIKTWGNSAGIALQNMTRSTYIHNNLITNTSSDCVSAYADLHTGLNKWGSKYLYIWNDTCLNSNSGCYNLKNSSYAQLIQNNCTNALGSGIYMWDTAKSILIKRNYFATITGPTIYVRNIYGGQVNASVYYNSFIDITASSNSNQVRWYNNGEGNYWSNNTVDKDCDGLADTPWQIINASMAGQTDLFPLALPYGRTPPSYCLPKWDPEVLAVCDQMFANMNILAVVFIVFVGAAAIGALVMSGFNPLVTVIAIIAGIIASTVGLVILTSLC